MKHHERFLSGLLVFLGVLFSCTPIPQQVGEENFTLAVEKGRNSTVQIRMVRAESGEVTGVGSGFFVTPDQIATALHNVTGEDPVFAKLTGEETTWKIENVTAFNVKGDLVILKVAGKGKPLRLANSNTVQIGEPVATLGFPETKYKVTEGTIHGIGDSNSWFRVKAEYVGGMSGGPVLNRKGEVIGVAALSSGVYGYIIPSNALKILLSQSNSTESLTQFRKRDAIRALVYYREGQRRFLRGDYDGAIDALNEAIDLDPEFINAYGIRALQKVHLGESEAAKGNTEVERDYYNKAIADFNEAFKLNPYEAPEEYRLRGWAKAKLGESEASQGNIVEAQLHYHEAIQDFDKALELNQEYASAYSNRGYVKAKFGESKVSQDNVKQARRDYRAAIDDYTEAIRRMPTSYAESSLARLYAKRLFQPEKANTYNKRADLRFELGEFETAQNNTEKAERYYRTAIDDYTEAINLRSDHAVVYYSRGLAKRALGLHGEAKADFEKSAELNREIEDSHDD
jgi:tetratricopeptide (TPR) repeat protein